MILLIKYMVQTVRVFVHPVLLSLSRGKRLYVFYDKSYKHLLIIFRNGPGSCGTAVGGIIPAYWVTVL